MEPIKNCQLTLTEAEILAIISALNHSDRRTKRATELKETIYSRLGRRFVDVYNDYYLRGQIYDEY